MVPLLDRLWRLVRSVALLQITYVIVSDSVLTDQMNPEKRLFWDLMETYDRNSRPVLNANTSVKVNFAVALNQIMDLDEKNQILTTSLWVYQDWKDYNLNWDPRDYEGINKTVIPATDLWLPDVYIFNNADEGMTGFVNVNGSKALVSSNGKIRWTVPMIIKSACVVRVLYFPFDYQLCQIKFGSWIYDGYQLDLTKRTKQVDLKKYVENSEFDLLIVQVNRVTLNFDCCPEPYHQLHLKIKIRRKALYYTYTVIAPSILLCILTMSSFLLPCDCGEKIAIGMTVFLAIYFLQMLIADNIPESNATPLVGIFLTMVMTMNSVSLIMATCIMNLKKRGERKRPPQVPRKVLDICKKVLGKITCTKFQRPDRCLPTVMITRPEEEDDDRTSVNSTLPDDQYERLSATLDDRLSTMNTEAGSRLSRVGLLGDQEDPEDSEARFRENLKKKALEIRRQIKYEWSYVAEVIDSFLFIVYMFVSVVTIVVVLIVMPHIHERANMESEDQIPGAHVTED
ncbi:neuronal acetylcholine receptor subunit alpha-10-like [Lineus longissimus]|uniref:neuronal acetylcholine receptor subunit alpha-10-like n=1 Tax=Lineus longissimus TaxID=88925 RepID=UPI002B4F9618